MDYQNLPRDRLSPFSAKVEAACAQNPTDLLNWSENLAAALLRELMGLRNLGNLNAGQRKNHPAPGSPAAIHDKRLSSLVKIQTAPMRRSATARAEA
jgi:hypothetical protein